MKIFGPNGVRLFSAINEACWREPYNLNRFIKDTIAGITVGIIAIPLAMALAISSGVAPQYGLYTAIIAGFIIALTGGARYSVSGPTAAFVVILYPVSMQFGLSGLLVATLLSGIFLILMGLARFGRLIEYIPLSVTLGFTSGIAITIATMQIKDFFGLTVSEMPESYFGKLEALFESLPTLTTGDTLVGIATLLVLIYWPRLRLNFPAHLPALITGGLVMFIVTYFDFNVTTIGSRFSYQLADGTTGQGIPPILPQFLLPWQLPDASGNPVIWNWQTISKLLPIALSMSMLGAIESLLCAVVIDEATHTKHQSNNELISQGLGNLIAPFFGGITATAAIARSTANVRAGATSPIAAIIHSLMVLLILLGFASLLSLLPLASMAALLLIVAWNMSAAPRVISLIKYAPKDDIIVMILCMLLTVLFDMVIAITVGIVIASLLFMRRIARMTKLSEIDNQPNATLVLRVNGPLFFAAAERIFSDIYSRINNYHTVILQWDAVPVLDAGGLSAFQHFVEYLPKGTMLYVTDIAYQPLKTLARAKVMPIEGRLAFCSNLSEALTIVAEKPN